MRFTFCTLITALIFATGCTGPQIEPSPLNPADGWNFLRSQDPDKLDKAIRDDYQAYIQSIPPLERPYVGGVNLFGDGKGQYAVTIGVNYPPRQKWTHVLFYNKENQRVRTVKYFSARYQN
jgi:hypothetical protein